MMHVLCCVSGSLHRRNDSFRDVQTAKGEDEHQDDLLSSRELETFQYGQGQDSRRHICCDIDRGICEPNGGTVDAGSFDALVPEIWDWRASENSTKEGRAGVHDYDSHENVASDPERVVWEYAQVLQQDGKLGEA